MEGDDEHSPVWRDYPVLHRELGPIRAYLADPEVSEISVNRPGHLFVEKLAVGMLHVEDAALTRRWISTVATLIASATHQVVNESHPLLSASLPSGERVQCALPPAAPQGGAISIRKQIVTNLTIEDYAAAGAFARTFVSEGSSSTVADQILIEALRRHDVADFLAKAVQHRVSMLISGGTSSGKTSFLNALMKLIPSNERIITIEDAPELITAKPNTLSLITSKGGQSQARVDAQDLLEAALRMRPDRILLGELRGSEAASFLHALNTGHPGSLSTIHANSPASAYERLALMVQRHYASLPYGATIEYLKRVVPVVVQVARDPGSRSFVIQEIAYARWTGTLNMP